MTSADRCPHCNANSLHYSAPLGWQKMSEYPLKYECYSCGEAWIKLMQRNANEQTKTT